MILCNLLSSVLLFTVLTKYTETTHTFHKLRHRHKRKQTADASAVQRHSNHIDSDEGTQFVLNCPYVQDAHLEQVKVQVTWTKDETIWLKIRNGERLLSNKPTAFHRRSVGNKSVLRVTLNNGRYIFLYDETKGNFSMTVSPINYAEDTGLWQCHVTVQKDGKMQSMTSRNRVKNRQQKLFDDSGQAVHDYQRKPSTEVVQNEPIRLKASPFSAFTRNEQSTIEIARNAIERDDIITFTRQSSGPVKHSSNTGRKMVVVENDGEDDDTSFSKTVQMRRLRKSSTDQPHKNLTIMCLILASIFLLSF